MTQVQQQPQMPQGYSQPMQQQTQQQVVQQPQKTKLQRLNEALTSEYGKNLVMGRCGDDKEKADTFRSSLIDLFGQDSDLQKCEPREVIQEALKAVSINLPLIKSLGLAWLIARNVGIKQPDGTKRYKVVPCFQIGYQGWKNLALRTGEFKYLNDGKLYEGELVRNNKLEGTLEIDASCRKSDTIIGYFAHFQTLRGYKHTVYMTVDEMCEHAKLYGQVPKDISVAKLKEIALQDKPSKTVGWVGNFSSMARKTVLIQLLKGWSEIATHPRLMTAIDSEVEDVSNDEDYNASRQQAETINLSSDMYQELPMTPSEEPLPSELTTPQF